MRPPVPDPSNRGDHAPKDARRIDRPLLVQLLAVDASALPATGTPSPDAKVESVDGTPHASELAGKLVLIFYENKGSAEQNRAFKIELVAELPRTFSLWTLKPSSVQTRLARVRRADVDRSRDGALGPLVPDGRWSEGSRRQGERWLRVPDTCCEDDAVGAALN